MTDISCTRHHPASQRISFLARLRTWRALAAQRRQLAQLDPSQLDDIGLDAAQAAQEASRPAWDVPSHWRQ